jgi:tRNA U54 and U55 pseudouridine synthase Pus10
MSETTKEVRVRIDASLYMKALIESMDEGKSRPNVGVTINKALEFYFQSKKPKSR